MQISVKITLDHRRTRKNGTRSIVIRIIKDRSPTYLSTGYSILPENFVEIDESNIAIKKNPFIKNIYVANKQIKKLHTELEDFIQHLIEDDRAADMTSTEIKNAFLNRDSNVSLNAFMLNKIEEFKASNRRGYADVWKDAERFMERALVNPISFKSFNLKTIKKLEKFHLAKNPEGLNGLAVWLRTIRTAYYAYAKESDIILKSNPWSDYTIRKKRTRKRATTGEIIKLFRDHEVKHGMKNDAKQFYMLSFYLAGMNLIDFAHLKVKQIYDNKIHYTRAKVDEEITIPIPPQAQEILNHYLVDKKKSDYVLPILDPKNTTEENHTLYKSRRNSYNKLIGKLFEEIGVVSEKRITFYSARHSWASRANEKNKPLTAISQGLGHTNIKTTQIYLEELNDNVLDELNRDVIDLD